MESFFCMSAWMLQHWTGIMVGVLFMVRVFRLVREGGHMGMQEYVMPFKWYKAGGKL